MRTDFLAPFGKCAAAGLALLLGGCAALQIDVDVYKGPLINNEQIQQQQVISMALSAEVLMRAARNQFIELALKPDPNGTENAAPASQFEGRLPSAVTAATAPAGDTPTRLACQPVARTAPHATHLCEPWRPVTPYEKAKQCYAAQFGSQFFADIPPRTDLQSKYLRMAFKLNELLVFYHGRSVPDGQPCGDAKTELSRPAGDSIRALAEGVRKANESLDGTDPMADPQQEPKLSAVKASARLERKLADLASQMQFLATNQWLVEDDDKDTDRYRALFEAIANTILLHIDDIQNRRKFDDHAKGGTATEIASYNNAIGAQLGPKRPLPGKDGAKEKQAANQGDNVDVTTPDERTTHAFRPLAPGKQDNAKSIDVMDALIAELRYFHIRVLKEKGKDDAETQFAAQALVEARKQRALMIYLRPSSAYLRSVFATTYTQQDPGLTWQNLLNDRFKDLLGNVTGYKFKREDPKVREIRSDLDKVYWQNINTVRVSGAGSTNFVVAKDDVGNWYVKSMGADPEAMIKAATNTALFSYSGKIDTNLLRVAQLRERIDNEKTGAEQRKDALAELRAYKVATSGPAAAAHGNTWTLFEDNYRKQAATQLTAMHALLKDNGLFAELRRRWENSLPTAALATQRTAVIDAFKLPAVTTAGSQALAALETADARTNPSGAVIEALEALHRGQGALRAYVLAEKSLTGTETARLAKTETARTNAEEALAQALENLTIAEANLKSAEAAVKAGTATDADVAKTAFDQARKNVDADTRRLTNARAAVLAATDALDAANGRREALLADLDIAVGKYIQAEGRKRMTANDEMETAARIVGQSVSGQPIVEGSP